MQKIVQAVVDNELALQLCYLRVEGLTTCLMLHYDSIRNIATARQLAFCSASSCSA